MTRASSSSAALARCTPLIHGAGTASTTSATRSSTTRVTAAHHGSTSSTQVPAPGLDDPCRRPPSWRTHWASASRPGASAGDGGGAQAGGSGASVVGITLVAAQTAPTPPVSQASPARPP
ncbi:MAG: hypothetical protein PHW78_08465 [Macromonas bipunctata]|nr:hypothetical protein [Macromonas bipunctata]